MIVEWIWEQICSLLGWLLSLFPTFSLPGWVVDANGYITSGIETINGLHNWLPLDAMRNAITFLLAVGSAILAVRVFRIGLSLFTGGGGGAA